MLGIGRELKEASAFAIPREPYSYLGPNCLNKSILIQRGPRKCGNKPRSKCRSLVRTEPIRG
eukprot:3854948-Prorocentrum_lima.AAC.1